MIRVRRSHLNKVMSTSMALAAVMILSFAASGRTGSPRFKMTTDMPPGIASSDKVETRLGTLNFFDGFPDDATVEKIYDNLELVK